MMASNLIALAPLPTTSPPRHLHLQQKTLVSFPPSSPSVSFGSLGRGRGRGRRRRRRRGDLEVRAGPPSTTSLIFAFVLPLSLIVGTVFASIRIADRLDEQFLEELAMNKAVMEENEEEEEEDGGAAVATDGDGNILFLEEEEVAAPVPRARNRPRREA